MPKVVTEEIAGSFVGKGERTPIYLIRWNIARRDKKHGALGLLGSPTRWRSKVSNLFGLRLWKDVGRSWFFGKQNIYHFEEKS